MLAPALGLEPHSEVSQICAESGQIRAKVLQFKPIGDLAVSDETQIRAPSDHNQGTSEHEKRALCVPPQEESASAELDRVMLLWSRLTADEKAQMLIDIGPVSPSVSDQLISGSRSQLNCSGGSTCPAH